MDDDIRNPGRRMEEDARNAGRRIEGEVRNAGRRVEHGLERTRERASGAVRSLFAIDVIAMVLVIIGAVTLGLIGLFQWNLLHAIFGAVPWLERLIYVAIGAGGVYTAIVTPVLVRLHRTSRQPTVTQQSL
ncbi:MAG: DUF378 domain-containing protein [Phycisphaerae bacterium]|nr:DUF378 domain-containing protein [Phycisphaerae bacterium]